MAQNLTAFDPALKDLQGRTIMDSPVKTAMKRSVTAKKAKWAQAARDRMEQKGTVGSLTRIASSHGEKPMPFAREHYNDPGLIGKKSRYAVNINK